MTATQDTLRSSYREILLEHLFIGAVMRHLWLRGIAQFEVLKPQVDDSGYDLVLEANSFVRHVQLKTSADDSSTATVNVSMKLAKKPLAEISRLPVTKHTKANAQGIKLPRPGYRVLRRAAFIKLDDIEHVVTRLFGSFPTVSEGP